MKEKKEASFEQPAKAPSAHVPDEEIPTINLDDEDDIRIEDVPF
ncbi:MAG: hypothetical protein WDN67_00750 [Candidatus Moraniibacteriota bacterium]